LSESLPRMGRGWYWRFHKYERVSVETDIKEFCGWDFLLGIIRECENTPYSFDREYFVKRDKGLITALFLTGGRVIEVLELRKRNFELDDPEWIIVRGMRVAKRYKKIGEYMDKEGNTRWITETKFEPRGRFPIPRKEPLVPYLLDHLNQVDDYLFPSPKTTKKRPHMTTTRAYQIVNNVGKRLGVHLYDHWFRAQRACQLAEEYEFELHDLLDFFGWKHIETARRYSRLSTRTLKQRIKQAKKYGPH